MESFSLDSHLVKKLELSKLRRKKLWGSENPENGLFKKSQPIKKETYFFVLFCYFIKAKWLKKKLHYISKDLIK